MALTRKSLKAMGITEEQVDSIIEAHTETIEGLKAEIAQLKDDAAKVDSLQKELNTLKGNDWEKKYNDEKAAHDKLKNDIAAEKTTAEKTDLYKAALKSAGVAESKIAAVLKVTDLSKIEVKDGKLKDADGIANSIKEEWSDFIVKATTKGASVDNPPQNNGTAMTRESIMAITDRNARRAAIAEHMDLFDKE